MISVCTIDFGTSNSAIALLRKDGVHLVELAPGYRTMTTAAFYSMEGLAGHEDPNLHYGRAAVDIGLSDDERKNPTAMGTVVTYTFRAVTPSGKPRFASYLRIAPPQ